MCRELIPQFDVFVSYSNRDRPAALLIKEAIGQAGLKAWRSDMLDPPERTPDLHEQYKRVVETAQCVVVLWSEEAAQSQFVREEIGYAIQAWSFDRLVLATLDDTPLPVGLRDLSAISIRDETDSGTKQLIERARAIVERSAKQRRLAESAPRKAGRPIKITALVVAAVLIGMAFLSLLSVRSAEVPLALWLLPVLISLVLGAAIGGAAVWAWTARGSRRRSNRAPSATLSLPVPAKPNGPPPVFVSYSRQDGRVVEQLVEQIEQLGYEVWIDRQSISPQRYAAPIVRAIRMSRLVALMCSQNAFASDHVIREVYLAGGDYKKPFVVFQLDSTEFPDDILYFVSGFPRVPVATIDPQQLRSQIAQLVAA